LHHRQDLGPGALLLHRRQDQILAALVLHHRQDLGPGALLLHRRQDPNPDAL
jgi:hypothetical protein